MKTSASTLTRRRFLLGATAGGIATAAAVAHNNNKTPQAQSKKTETASGGKGYHVTEHVRKYYNTAKL